MKQEVIDNHIIYGTWDPTGGDQFLVFYHPNGIDCTVFLLGGADYGGGIIDHFNCKSSDIDGIVETPDISEYEAYKMIQELKEKINESTTGN